MNALRSSPVARGLRVVHHAAASCNVLAVNTPVLLHLYLIVDIDRRVPLQ
jgi:hypothetical protein